MLPMAALAIAAAGGCSPEPPSSDPSAATGAGHEVAAVARQALSSSAGTGGTCSGTGAHDKHAALGIGCVTCHACGGQLGFTAVTYPRGATTADGTITYAGASTTCSVGCHSPIGASPHAVAWNAGPLQCTDCHTNVVTLGPGAARSSHPISGSITSATCQSCHDTSQHTSGQVRIFSDDGTSETGTCAGCHAGQGETLAGRTPPLLVGWSDTASGDFHGERAGTCRFDPLDPSGARSIGQGALLCPDGQPDAPNALRITSRWWYLSGTSGAQGWTCDIETVNASGVRIGATATGRPCPAGTILNSLCSGPTDPDCVPTTLVTRGFGGALLPPYRRGQGPLTCATCHDFHASTNAFLLAAKVNGLTIPPGTIDRAGVGAQALCGACHAGDRHEVCRSCHKEFWRSDGESSWFEGAPVDPVPDGSACFYCHGHEGIRQMEVSSPAYPDGHPWSYGYPASACSHCHDATWHPPPTEYVAPRISPAPVVSGVTGTTATVSWGTSERATSYVEYGPGTPGWVAGDAALVTQHSVTLTGLAPSTTYVWRVRSSDSFRNATVTALQTFTTTSANALPRPDLIPVGLYLEVPTSTTTVALSWYGVTAPSGTAVEYEVQLASDAGFTHLVNGSMAGPGVPGMTIGDSGWVSGTPTSSGGKPAWSYPATLTNIPQDWCTVVVPNTYYWRVRARDQQGNVSDWSAAGVIQAFAWDPWC